MDRGRPTEYEVQPEWAKSEFWPDRLPAPGYPKRYTKPLIILAAVAAPLLLIGIFAHSPAVAAIAFGGFVILASVNCAVTIHRFRCPRCQQRIVPKYWEEPQPGETYKFHCRRCRVIWDTRIRAPEPGTD